MSYIKSGTLRHQRAKKNVLLLPEKCNQGSAGITTTRQVLEIQYDSTVKAYQVIRMCCGSMCCGGM